MPKKGAFVIYDETIGKDNPALKEITDKIIELRDSGITKNHILSIIEEVYKDD